MTNTIPNSINLTSAIGQPSSIRLVMPQIFNEELLVRFLKRRNETLIFGKCSRVVHAGGSIEWLVKELLSDRSALVDGANGSPLIAFTLSEGSVLTPWVDSNLLHLPRRVVAEVFYGDGPFRGLAWGFVRQEGGPPVPMSELFLPGAEMRRIPLRAVDAPAPTVTEERYSRTVGAWGEQGPAMLARLQAAPVAIYGASRTGLFIAEYLVRLGAEILLCDPKPLKDSHLGEISLLLSDEDVGHSKAMAFARRIGEWSLGRAKVEPIVARADSAAGANAARRAGWLCDCCDTDSGRLAVGMLATVLLKPQLSIASGVHYDSEGNRHLGADVRLLLPGDRCLLCLGGLADYSGALRELASGPSSSEPEDWHLDRAGSLRSLNQAATAVGLRLIEDLYAGRVRKSRWVRLEWSEDGEPTTRECKVEAPRAACPLCRMAGEGDAALGFI